MIQGNLCTKHPEFKGRRHNDRNCPGCVKDRQTAPEGKAIKAAAFKRWREKNIEKVRAYDAEWRRANQHIVRANNLKRTGFTPELFDQALAAQHFRCPICERDLRQLKTKAVHADHCHATGLPRGILCHHCNAALGAFRDDPDVLRRAIAYLAAPPLSLA